MQPAFLNGLNPEQLEAVTLSHQSALILAGAGSGKTRVLTTRIAWLISTGQASPAAILAVTFTNKAAREMLTRLSAMLPINTRGMWIGTFHGLCNRLLRAHHRDAGLPQTFQILDSQDQQSAVKRLLKAMNVDDERFPPRQVQWFINGAKEEGRRARDVESYDDYTRRLTEIYAAYDEQCNREGVVDFAELLLRCFELLVRNEILREHYRARFRHILVDEFQDTNVLQYRWLKLLAGEGARAPAPFALTAPGASAAPAQEQGCAVFAVGDDDQSIYAFRGANVANMQHFERDFHVQRVIKLEQNYRSHGNILDAANAVIANNRKRLGKNLWTAEGKGEPIRIYEAMSDIEEASFIVDEVKTLVAEGVRRCDIALLYRSNAQSRVLEHALFSAGIAYRVYGGLRFFERQEIKHALAYLRLTANPEDDNALLRVVNFPTRGIGNRSLEQLQDAAATAGSSLWAAAKSKAEAGKRKADGAAGGVATVAPIVPVRGIEGFVALIERMRAACEGLTLAECVEHVVDASGLSAHYRAEREGAERLENLGELVNAAALFAADAGNEDASLTGFLAHAALEAGEHQAEAGVDALQLMTVHSAKGLEFHTVFLGGLEEGLFPHENSLSEDDGLDEERRLMYVAITRARRRLYVTYAQSRMLHGQTRYNIRSRFLLELPPLLLKPVGVSGARGEASSSRSAPRRSELGPTSFDIAPASPWRIGQSVVHPKFGRGVIVGAEGRGADARVQVNFQSGGMKWLALEYAKLTAA